MTHHHRRLGCHFAFALSLVVSIATSAFGPPGLLGPQAARAEESKPAGPDYRTEIKPILQKYCLGCHNASEAKGGLSLASAESIQKGGKHGPALVTGKGAESLLVMTITGAAKPAMPPKGNPKPTPAEIERLRQWIDAGALMPTGDEYDLSTPEIKPLTKPKVPITAIAYSPDGKLLALGQYQKVLLVDPATGHIVRTLEGTAGSVTSLRFTPDGKGLLSAAGEPGLFGEAVLWDPATGKPIRTFRGHSDSLYAAELSHDGVFLATAGYDKVIRIWDAETGEEIDLFKGHQDAVYSLAFSPDDKLLASASGDRTIKLWSVENSARLDTFTQPTKEQYAVAFSPDGKRLVATGVDRRIRAWSVDPNGAEGKSPILYFRFAHQMPAIQLVYAPDGKSLASSSEDRTVKLWDAAEIKERLILEKQPDWGSALIFSPDSKTLAVGRQDGTVGLYAAGDGKLIRAFEPKLPPPPKPELAALYPPAVSRGHSLKIQLTGKELDKATSIKTNSDKVSATLLAEPKPRPNAIWAEVRASKDAPLKPIELWVANEGGTSARLQFEIDPLTQTAEPQLPQAKTRRTITSKLSEARAVVMPLGIWGKIGEKGDIDFYAFEAKKGATIVADVRASRLKSPINPVLRLYSDKGRLLQEASMEGASNDPFLAFHVPEDGRYVLSIHDLEFGGDAKSVYQIVLGEIPYVTSLYPAVIKAGEKTPLRLEGYNLPKDAQVESAALPEGRHPISLDKSRYRSRRSFSVLATNTPRVEEAEPNDRPDKAVRMAAPGIAQGKIEGADGANDGAGDFDLYAFEAKKGQQWIIETLAQKLGSPLDTRIEVLNAKGEPVERMWLHAVRESQLNFRDTDSVRTGLRSSNSTEFILNQLIYIDGEVGKIFRMPQGPDSDYLFYADLGGRRQTYLDTTATAHALGDMGYIVEPHPVGASIIPNGLPVFKLRYANDDASDRRWGTDSRLTFTAPADGTYLVRVRDTYGRSDSSNIYQLTIREPKPDFKITLATRSITGQPAGGATVKFTCEREDDFEGDVAINVAHLPAGWTLSSPILVEAGHHTAWASLMMDPSAKTATADELKAIRITATATIDGSPREQVVDGFTNLKAGGPGTILVTLGPPEVSIKPGDKTYVTIKVDRRDYKGRIRFNDRGLPHGVIVGNIGLSGILIPEGASERTLVLESESWVGKTTLPFFLATVEPKGVTSNAILVKVEPDKQIVTATEPKETPASK